MRMPRWSKVSTTLPGIARHMSFSLAQVLVRHHSLSERKATVVGRNLGVQKDVKAATPQLYPRPAQKVQVLDAPTAKANPIHRIARPNTTAHFPNGHAKGVVKARGNLARPPSRGNISHYGDNNRPKVEDGRFALLYLEVVATVDPRFCRRFQGNGCLAFEAHLRSQAQQRRHGVEEPPTGRCLH